MAQSQKDPLRALSKQEEQELHRLINASSERVDVVRRATALVAVAGGQGFAQAAREAGLKSGYGVSKLVKRFNTHGLAALCIAAGRGRKTTYTSEQQARILTEVQRTPDRDEDQTATWSLMLLRQALRKTDLPHVAAETIRQVLHEQGYSYQRTRSWCRTGYARRKRKSGTVTTYDEQTRGAKKSDRAGVRASGSSHEQNSSPKPSAQPVRVGRRGWAMRRAVQNHPCASCWCWIIWLGTCRMIWCAGCLIMG